MFGNGTEEASWIGAGRAARFATWPAARHDRSHLAGWVRTEDAANHVTYIDQTGMREYSETPGNLAAIMLHRDLDDGRTEFVTMSFWESMDAIRAFAGDDVTAAVYYPDDERFLVDRENTVTHFDVASAAAAEERAASLPSRL
jgi:heme-degrading monooxygenase HmoA